MPAAANDQPPLLRRPAVLLFGDSLTERCFEEGGWGAALAHHFARKVDVINRGFGGYNSKWALPVLDQVLLQISLTKQPVLFATLWLGANDAALPDRSAVRQHVPLHEYKANLQAMIAKMQAAGISRIVLVTPACVYDAGRIKHQQQRMGIADPVEPDRTNEYAARYAQAVRVLGAKHNLPVLDLHTALQQEPGWQTELLSDGLHFTPAGSTAVGQRLIALLQDAYPDLSLSSLPNHMPWWDKFAEAGPANEAALWQGFLASNE